ncbi:hypothetical protein EFA46_009790 [Halarchaeum sp. CBA1220]|uniref:hypothetical protein n=1 Tax=Halarchaeum sp. CBA1220 TaxID=1853682 RepID=UPI000F3A9236|nr:hypothetical protein [Halarchaeum sp. CBA1220]QLC34484.1 hypothetical protein EFA46_009790 [Halarchaeum sp. CBA1220]
MTLLETATLAVFGVQVVAVVGCALVLGAVLARSADTLLYPEGVRWLTTTLAALALGATLDLAQMTDAWRPGALEILAQSSYALAATLAVGAMWYFARDFVRTDDRFEPMGEAEDDAGGFEDA